MSSPPTLPSLFLTPFALRGPRRRRALSSQSSFEDNKNPPSGETRCGKHNLRRCKCLQGRTDEHFAATDPRSLRSSLFISDTPVFISCLRSVVVGGLLGGPPPHFSCSVVLLSALMVSRVLRTTAATPTNDDETAVRSVVYLLIVLFFRCSRASAGD